MTEAMWTPERQRIERANVSAFIDYVQRQHSVSLADYHALYDWSITNPEAFWQSIWDYFDIIASQPASEGARHLDEMPGAEFFPDARLNFAENLLRYRDDRVAIELRDEAGRQQRLTYRELYERVAALASALRREGIRPGDRVAGYLPNIPETVIAMLATASIGAIWSSCSPDFGVNGVLDRFGQIEPKLLLTADGYNYNGKPIDSLDRVAQLVEQVPSIERIVVVPFRDPSPDISGLRKAVMYADFVDDQPPELEFEQLPFAHPLYILYSSGTTGKPKCIVHSAGGTLMQHLKELALHTDVKREDKLFYFTTCGWMMWNWLVSGLALGTTIVLYDGSPFHPDGRRLWDVADDVGISIFGASAKYFQALEKADIKPRESHDLTPLKAVLSTGSPLLPESFDYIYRDIKQDLCLSSISGGTDIVSCFALGCPTLPVHRGELQCRGLGMKVQILDDRGQPVIGQKGELACTMGFPSMPIGFWNDPDGQRYRKAYFEKVPGVWCHGDQAELTEHGGLIIYGRSDSTLNPGGVRIGTAEIYRQVERLPEVVESLAVGQRWRGDERIVLFVRLRDDVELDPELTDRIKRTIRENTTPRHVPAKVLAIGDIPRTVNGKIAEVAVRNIIHGEPVKNIEALANPESLELYTYFPELETD